MTCRVRLMTCVRWIAPGLLGSLLVLAGAPQARGWGGEEHPNFCPCPTGGPQGLFPNDEFELGAANSFSVLELRAHNVDMTGPEGGVFGDVGIAPGGKLSVTGSQFITGAVFLGAGATFQNSTHSAPGGGVQTNADLSGAISDAFNASADLSSRSCEQTFATWSSDMTVTATHGGLYVVCVGDVVLNGGKVVTLTGNGVGPIFVINVSGKFVLTGGSDIVAASDVNPADILYNIVGRGSDVAMNGGGGGLDCCNATVDGTLLAPDRRIALSPGLVRGGAVVSGLDISIVSGARVTCPLQCPAP
jgi:choice-of-anchor A domain-containing protein